MNQEPEYIRGLAASIFRHMKYKLRTYDEKLLEEALTANESQRDFNGSRWLLTIERAERVHARR